MKKVRSYVKGTKLRKGTKLQKKYEATEKIQSYEKGTKLRKRYKTTKKVRRGYEISYGRHWSRSNEKVRSYEKGTKLRKRYESYVNGTKLRKRYEEVAKLATKDLVYQVTKLRDSNATYRDTLFWRIVMYYMKIKWREFPMVIGRGRRREHPKDTSEGITWASVTKGVAQLSVAHAYTQGNPEGVKWPLVTSGSHVTTTKKKTWGKNVACAEHTFGQDRFRTGPRTVTWLCHFRLQRLH